MPISRAEMFAEFEKDGEALVRERLIIEHYGAIGNYRRGFAEEWLRLKEETRKKSFNSKLMNIARSNKYAAWVAAIAALDISDYLRAHGYAVIEANSAAEAIQVLKTDVEVAVVFTDVRMPGTVDGIAAKKTRPETRTRAGLR
jgi:response regulator RpfG family c-di-GMP phosphodiesterase